MKLRLILIGVVIATLIIFYEFVLPKNIKTVKIGFALQAQSHYGVSASRIKSELNESLDLKLFPNSILGSEREMIESLKLGTLDMAIVSTGALQNFVPQVGVFDMPYLFRDIQHARSVLDDQIGNDMLKKISREGVVALAWGEQGFRHLTNSKHPVQSFKDARGLKIRTTQNAIHIRAFKSMGFSPAPMSWAEVPSAMSQGVIDGQENSISVMVSEKVYQYQKHLSLTAHFYAPAVILASEHFYDRLSEQQKEQVRKAAHLGAQQMRAFVDNMESKGLEKLRAEGMQVVTDVDKDSFAVPARNDDLEYYKLFGKDLIEEIRAHP
ncbi:TRAP transporter substrate-binding protein [Taylorella equigenitalis]|uniref:TRAP transporter substrate-binding protein n=1 Tax=Taylorella equigenitalis TaxID=29575 RepID=UPI00237CE9C5|nr:TRAP transporter substrate-binding protein [Taylorella equigenitalis]WDU49508.1 TRAP transporter substrate-binding protein [Taylorella equigenitalis]